MFDYAGYPIEDKVVREPTAQRIGRLYYDGGGKVDVERAAKEPDERIDKMTGVPYDQQAGGAFVDVEDPLRRLGFLGGGIAEEDPLRRLGFLGGGIAEEDPLRRLGFLGGGIAEGGKVLKALKRSQNV